MSSTTVSVVSFIGLASLIILEVLMPLALSTKNFIISVFSLSVFSTKPIFCMGAPLVGLVSDSFSDSRTIPDSASQKTFSVTVSARSPLIVLTPSTFSTDRMLAN